MNVETKQASSIEKELTESESKPNVSVVLLVDDQLMVSEGVRRMLSEEPDIDYHYCSDPREAVSMAEEIQPTIILQDLIMPEIDGFRCQLSRRAKKRPV